MTHSLMAALVVVLSFSACGPGAPAEAAAPAQINRAEQLGKSDQFLVAQATEFDAEFIPALVKDLAAATRAARSSAAVTEGIATMDDRGVWSFQSSSNGELAINHPKARQRWVLLQVTGDILSPKFPLCSGCTLRGTLLVEGAFFRVELNGARWSIEADIRTQNDGSLELLFEAERSVKATSCAVLETWNVVGRMALRKLSATNAFTRENYLCTCDCSGDISAISVSKKQLSLDDDGTTWEASSRQGWFQKLSERDPRLVWDGEVRRNGKEVGAFIAPGLKLEDGVSRFHKQLRVGDGWFEYGTEDARNDSEVRRE